jgi:hypothetical protein
MKKAVHHIIFEENKFWLLAPDIYITIQRGEKQIEYHSHLDATRVAVNWVVWLDA